MPHVSERRSQQCWPSPNLFGEGQLRQITDLAGDRSLVRTALPETETTSEPGQETFPGAEDADLLETER